MTAENPATKNLALALSRCGFITIRLDTCQLSCDTSPINNGDGKMNHNPTTYHVESRLNENQHWEFLGEHATYDEASDALNQLVNEDAEFQKEDFFFYRIVKVDKLTLDHFQRQP